MTVYCDNDVLLRLAVYDLAEPVLRALGAAPGDVRVLATARFWIGVRDPERGRRRYGEDAFERARALLEAFGPVVDESPDPVEESVLAGVAGLDVGEIVLFTAAARDPGALVLTGDKRALETLPSDARCRDLARTLEGRILCWEQMLELALRAAPFEAVRARIAPRLEVDTATRAIFGSGAASTERSVRDAVAAYVADLRRRTGRLLRE